MTKGDIMRITLSLIEEYNKDSELLTDDPDISAKHCDVINQVMYELARLKKIARYIPVPVQAGQVVTFQDLREMIGQPIYQIATIRNVPYESYGDGTIYKFAASGTADIDCYVYPQRITNDTPAEHELELSDDVLNILPYGVAADLLKSDVSANYGTVYEKRYKEMLDRLDPRYRTYGIYIEGGFDAL